MRGKGYDVCGKLCQSGGRKDKQVSLQNISCLYPFTAHYLLLFVFIYAPDKNLARVKKSGVDYT